MNPSVCPSGEKAVSESPKEVKRLGSTNLANDDAIRPHTEGVANQIALSNLVLTLDVGGPRLTGDYVPLLKLELHRWPRRIRSFRTTSSS